MEELARQTTIGDFKMHKNEGKCILLANCTIFTDTSSQALVLRKGCFRVPSNNQCKQGSVSKLQNNPLYSRLQERPHCVSWTTEHNHASSSFKTLENFTCSLPSIKISTLQKIIDALHKVVMQGSDLWVIRPIIHELKGRLQWSVISRSHTQIISKFKLLMVELNQDRSLVNSKATWCVKNIDEAVSVEKVLETKRWYTGRIMTNR